MSNKPAFWFPVKPYGWGWGLPVCWQGWVVLLAYLALIIGGLRYFGAQRAPVSNPLIFCAVLTIIFVAIVIITGERPVRWRWGRK
jgi:hypothetical protein